MFAEFSIQTMLPSLIALLGVLAVLGGVFWLVKRGIRRLADRMEERDRGRVEEIERWAAQLIRFVRHAVELVAGVAAVFIILRGLGIRGIPELTWEQVVGWLVGPGMRILFVVGGAFVISRVLHLLIAQLPVFVVPSEGPLAELAERKKRADTISRLLGTVMTILIMSAAVLIVLKELGVDITPILTGSAIAGLAVGFGAQNLVRDVISGFFLILEDQVRVGDVARINGQGGFVEAIRLRTIVLRSLDGTVHVFPNGAIHELSNMTKDFSFAVLDLGVAYRENVDQVIEVLREVGEELRNDPNYSYRIMEPMEVLGVENFADSAVVIRVRFKTVPLQQWNVLRELRRRVKNTFDARGIEIPYPHVSVYFGSVSKPFAVEVAEQLRKTESRS